MQTQTDRCANDLRRRSSQHQLRPAVAETRDTSAPIVDDTDLCCLGDVAAEICMQCACANRNRFIYIMMHEHRKNLIFIQLAMESCLQLRGTERLPVALLLVSMQQNVSFIVQLLRVLTRICSNLWSALHVREFPFHRFSGLLDSVCGRPVSPPCRCDEHAPVTHIKIAEHPTTV
jgi:hypothetical protein